MFQGESKEASGEICLKLVFLNQIKLLEVIIKLGDERGKTKVKIKP